MPRIMKYKVGDTVRIKKDLEVGEIYGGVSFVEEMQQYLGQTTTIIRVTPSYYNLKIDKGVWSWSDEMLGEVEGLRAMKIGDIVIGKDGAERKVLDVREEIFGVSCNGNYNSFYEFFTYKEAEELGWKLKEQKRKIIIDGKETEISDESYKSLKKSLCEGE